MKNCLGKYSLEVTLPDGECSKILVSNPEYAVCLSHEPSLMAWPPRVSYSSVVEHLD